MSDNTPIAPPDLSAALSNEHLIKLYCVECRSPRSIHDTYHVAESAVRKQLTILGIPLRNRYESRAASIASGRYGEAIKRNHWSKGAKARAVRERLSSRIVKPETKAKLSARVITEEWKEKLRNANTGKTLSDETKQKIGAWGKGRVGPNLGKKHDADRRARQSAAMKGRVFTAAHRAALSKAGKGHPPALFFHKGRTVDYVSRSGEVCHLMSSYEHEVAIYLDSIREDWRYVGRSKDDSFLLADGCRYYPDFYLSRLDIYIDPKGFDRNPEKRTAVETQHPGRVVFMIGETYLLQLKDLLCHK